MRRLFGYTLFWIAAGMFAGLFIDSVLLNIFLIFLLLLMGFNLFLC